MKSKAIKKKSSKLAQQMRVSETMRRVKSKNTLPEKLLRAALRKKGLRFKTCPPTLDGKPDIVFVNEKLAVFVDGDFWHGNQWRLRKLKSLEEQFNKVRTRDYWLSKIQRNLNRDCLVTSKLLANNWKVLRLWESDINKRLDWCVDTTTKSLNGNGRANGAFVAPSKTFCEFFAGIGLMRMGLERAGWHLAFANDIDPLKLEMCLAQFPDAERHYVVKDIHELASKQIPTSTLATASFPCNDLSLAGGRKGLSGSQSSAFWGFIDLLRNMGKRKPPLVLIENVPGFLTSHNGRDFEQALKALNQLGYSVDVFIVDAARFVPQSRQRLFIVGSQCADTFLNASGVRNFYESEIRPKALAQFVFDHPDIDWNIRELPPLPNTRKRLIDILETIPDNSPIWWDRSRSEYLLDQMSTRHREAADSMIRARSWSYGTVFRRVRNEKSMAELRLDGIAGCLRTPRGGSGRQILFKAGYDKYFVRLLTPRECARLMGADEFKIAVPLNQALFGFGDAVCVPVIEWIATHYLNPLVAEIIRGACLRSPVMTYGHVARTTSESRI